MTAKMSQIPLREPANDDIYKTGGHMEFVAVDVETANANLSSICQIGIVRFHDNKPTDQWKTLVNPNDYFDWMNVSIHGIDEDTVADAPTWPDIIGKVKEMIDGKIVVSHGSFDRGAIERASKLFDLPPPLCQWLDTCRVARRTWSEVSKRGYGLSALAERLGISFKHHDALEDARTAGFVLVRAQEETGLGVHEWVQRVKQPITPGSISHATEGNPNGHLYGETIVFTGELCIPRKDAAKLAAEAGCDVADGVTKHTTILVVGDQDARKLNGQEKSAKHRKAETLIIKGTQIRIITESDFLSIAASN